MKDPLSIRDVSMAAPGLEREGERERKRKRERSTDQHKDRGTHRLRYSSLWFLVVFKAIFREISGVCVNPR